MSPDEDAAAERAETAPAAGRSQQPDGGLAYEIEEGAVRCLRFAGVEVLRLIACPIRDADWGTLPVDEIATERVGALGYRRSFRTRDGALRGTLVVDGEEAAGQARLTATLDLVAERDAVVNRAGFVLLHPIAGVAGTPLEIVHPDGTVEAGAFPKLIAPGQPARDVAGLRHLVGGVAVEIALTGEVFEMEDQRNWTDASFKTYCRPLARPRPYLVARGETVRQQVRIALRQAGGARPPAAAAASARAVMPAVTLAHEPALTGAPSPAAGRLGAAGVLLRLDAREPRLDAPALVAAGLAIATLEIVTDTDAAADVARAADACHAAGLAPRRVVGLPRGYLASHQPDGPWPAGPRPMDLVPLLRSAFPEAEIGGGVLTNFTELNRCRPDAAAIDFVTFGTTALVHAADDRSVIETLEALGDVLASAREIAAGKPLHLGLVSIGMRSNPYGAGIAPNPDGERLPMAMDDPRQRLPFAAAWAVAAAAEAARGGAASLAPAMTGGPLCTGGNGGLWPIHHAVAALAALAGAGVEVSGEPGSGLVAIRGRGRRGVAGVVANLGPDAADWTEAPALALADEAATRDPDWIEAAGASSPLRLAPMTAAVLRERP